MHAAAIAVATPGYIGPNQKHAEMTVYTDLYDIIIYKFKESIAR